jgi:uncharacterized protein (DUF58 family)
MTPRHPEPKPSVWSAADVRRLQIVSSRLVTSIFAGDYRSVFRGRGVEFVEVRDYQPGDDVRSIDWNVTARTGRPFVKQFIEEREMTVMILLDLSPSLACPGPHGPKSGVAAEICALLAYAAVRSNDRVGLMTFTDRVERYIPPAKGARQARRLVSELLRPLPERRGTDLAGALDYLERVQRRGAILFLVSDFLAADFHLPLTAAARRHDVVAVSVTDPADFQLPDVGLLRVADAETGEQRLIDTSDARLRGAYREHAARRLAGLNRTLAAAGVEHLAVAAGVPPVQALTRFFHSRRQRLSR